MRAHYIVLLAAALVAVTGAAGDDHLGTRLLRTHKSTTSANEEERVNFAGFEIKIGLLDDIIERMNQSPMFKAQVDKRASAQDAYTAFKVDKVADNVFESAQWKEWAEYVRLMAKNKNEVPDENLAAGMSAVLTSAGLSNLLANTAKNDKTRDIVSKLEAAQLSRWLNGGYTPDAIFNTLALEKADDIFGTAPFATWTKFLTQYNKKHPKKMVSELDVLTSSYGEQKFIKMLSSADKSHPDVSQKLRDELVKGWMDDVMHPSSLFTRLKLHEAGDDLLTSPLLTTWVQYMQAFNEKYPKFKTTMIQTFTKSYDDQQIAVMIQAAKKSTNGRMVDFATNLQTAQFKQWMADKKTPTEMLSVLKLTSQTFTDNPAADIWRAYNKAYVKKFPSGEFAFQP
ncbi:hypothetical protein PHYPSEUDO_002780 [Phytophthora pseudosyringae]|uniref:RxLR effector protein n=1 Tax=Phytophthora pseudosyringae TaxID=221518 RepID=A0A8T1VSI6_9STRA|nr:hypothetical protein PHYPSEUDO_002780 [Phytophthora pseudosyringae]